MKSNAGRLALLLAAALLSLSCGSVRKAEKRLTPPEPPRLSREARLDAIRDAVKSDPALAIHLIGVYRAIYEEDSQDEALDAAWAEAVERLQEARAEAIAGKRWDDAASLARSLAALEIAVESTGEEDDVLLTSAKDELAAGRYLGAFLAAYRAHALKPLSLEDSRLFLDKAVEEKERQTAAFFLDIVESQGGEVDEATRAFSRGRDSPADMIKGVATVLVDRGIKVERGMGQPDRVLGSAFFVDRSGLLVTNYHVVASEVDPAYEGYSRMYIRLGDAASARIPAKVVGWDTTLDLALIKAEITPDYVFSVIGRITPAVGETVLAIGSPGGLEKTVTSGIVSALGRRFLQLGDVIQIDAAVNHGNSGGPVIDTQGRLVGIVFAGVEGYQGMNFAVPAERLAAALPAMLTSPTPAAAERPWLGLSLGENRGEAEIVYIAPDTPAAQARLPEGVTITSLAGSHPAAGVSSLVCALQDTLFSRRVGELVALETSDGKRRILRLTARPALPLAAAAKIDSAERLAAPLFGLVLQPGVGNTLMTRYLVKKVVRGSVADEAGLSPQDPVSIRSLRIEEKTGVAYLDLDVKKRASGYLETLMRLPAALDSPDTL